MIARGSVNIHHSLARLIESVNHSDFAKTYFQTIRQVADFDSAVIMAYGLGNHPEVLYDELAEAYRSEFYSRYLKGAFLLSPLYQTFKSNKQGFYSLAKEAPEGFFESEYYKKYYCYSGLIDQVFLIKRINSNFGIAVSIARTNKFQPFSENELNDLSLIEPVLLVLLSQQWGGLTDNQPSFTDYLNKAFDNFGVSVLSKREKQAVNCMLRGCSSKAAAEKLGVTLETERSYRKVIYSKLQVNSHSELYNLFFQSLEFADNNGNDDPFALLQKSQYG